MAARFELRARGEVPQLAPMVAVGWADCACGAGSLALAALLPPDGCVSVSCDLELVEAGTAVPVGRLVTFQEAAGSVPRTSLLLLSTPAALCEEEQTAVAAAVHEFAVAKQETAEGVQRLFLLVGAMRFPAELDDEGTLRALAFNGASSRKRPGFPAATPVPDGLLAGLLNIARASGTPTLALLAPAHLLRSQSAECLEIARTCAIALCGYLDCASGDVVATLRPGETASGEGSRAAPPSLMYV